MRVERLESALELCLSALSDAGIQAPYISPELLEPRPQSS